MCFVIKDKKLLDKYMKISEKVSKIIEKTNNELVYNKKYLKAEKGLL